MKKPIPLILALSGLLMPLLGCTKEPDHIKPAAADAHDEPVTLTIYRTGLSLTDTEFQTFFVQPVKKKYPHITLKLVVDEKGTTPEELLAANAFPDIIFTSNPSYFRLLNLNVPAVLDDWVKKSSFDVKRIKPVITDSLKLYSAKSELIALPFSLNVAALFYNKEIFDKFGVEYPKKVLTWEETLKLARELTRTDSGTRYIGIDLTEAQHLGRGLSLPMIEPKTGKAAVTTDSWVKVFQLLKQSYEIPGFVGDNARYTYGINGFLQERNLAMLPYWLGGLIGRLEELSIQGNAFNWDVAPLPNFPEAHGTGREIDIHSVMLSSLSSHKEQAWKVMTLMLSEEVQKIVVRAGRQTVLESTELEKEFGADLQSLKGKETATIFMTKPRLLHVPSEFDKDIVNKRLNDAAKELAVNGVDINTALRTAEANIDKDIASLKNTDRSQSGSGNIGK